MNLIEFLFWFSCFMLLYTVVLYPLLLACIGMFTRRQVIRDNAPRRVALIIPVHNGEKEIEEKILNCLAQKYPEKLLSIHIVSDGSTDGTVEIVNRYRDRGVHCLELTEGVGKVAAQNSILPYVDAEILIFTDVSILVPPTAVRDIVSNFADKSIGAVSCRDEIIAQAGLQGDSLYIQYDMIIRGFTSRIGSLIGVTGGFYAVRREIAGTGWEPTFPPDFFVALKALRMGYRVIEDSRVVARYYTPTSDDKELERKVRTITRGMSAFFANTALLNIFKYPLVSVQLISHKLLRWMAPFFFLTCLFTSAALAWTGAIPYQIIFGVQAVVLATGLVCSLRKTQQTNRGCRFNRMFFLFNLAILLSWKNFLTGKKIVRWEPTVRSGTD